MAVAVIVALLVALAVVGGVAVGRGVRLRALQEVATTDAKTGLLTAAAWERQAGRMLARSLVAGRPVAVLVVDIDRFKLVNDRYGHLAGDAVLRQVGGVLRSGVRASDTVGRFGGEEFVAVLPGAGDAEALAVAERLRARIREVDVSASIGVACAPADGSALPELLAAADAALYRAKRAGRDRVVLAER